MKFISGMIWVLFVYSCNAIIAQNAPVTTAGTVVSQVTSATVPVIVSDFNNIGSFGLTLMYDPGIISAVAVTASPILGGNLNMNLGIPGQIILGWYSWPVVSLPDSTVILNIDFTDVTTGSSDLTWFDDGYSCYYSDSNTAILNDLPAESYYVNGSVTTTLGIDEPAGDPLSLVAYPNPFREHATISWHQPSGGEISIYIFNVSGQVVESFTGKYETGGNHKLEFSSGSLLPGFYNVRVLLNANNELLVNTIKVICNK